MFSKLLKPLLWLLALCLAVYICICSYMFAQQRQMIFPGGGTQVAAESTDFSLQRADVLLRGWQLHPADGKARNAVIYFGGNAENIAHRRQQLSRSLPHTLSASRPSLLVPGWPLRLLARLLHWQQNIRTRRQLARLDSRLLGDAKEFRFLEEEKKGFFSRLFGS